MAETQSTRRLHGLLWILLAWAGLIFGRLVWLQVIHHDELAHLAQQQQQRTQQIPAARGSIFDRNGQTLAKSLPAESVCVNPQKISDPGMAADLLSRVLNLNREKVFDKIQEASLRGSGFLWIKRKILADEAARLRSLNLALGRIPARNAALLSAPSVGRARGRLDGYRQSRRYVRARHGWN